MKNDINNTISSSRSTRHYKALRIDIVRNEDVVKSNQALLSQRPRRKRRIDYAKKITNDPFIFNV